VAGALIGAGALFVSAFALRGAAETITAPASRR